MSWPSPAQLSPDQVSLAQLSPAQLSPAQHGQAQCSRAQLSPAQRTIPPPAQPSPASMSLMVMVQVSDESYVLCALAFMCVRVMSHYTSSPGALIAPTMPRAITIRDVLSYNLCGQWSDDRGNNYTVIIDEDGSSCTVRTVRPNGRVITTPGLIRGRLPRLTWGLNFVLRTVLNGDDKPEEILWQPIRPGPKRLNFKWRRCDTRLVLSCSYESHVLDSPCLISLKTCPLSLSVNSK